ncbi:MAG: hypothetical protein ACREKL_13190, partial [Chthoniobacterales bacterium]
MSMAMPPRVVFIGDLNGMWKSGAQRLAAAREQGAEIAGKIDYGSLPTSGPLHARFARLFGRPAFPGLLRAFNHELLSQCATLPRPDICWVEWPRLVLPGTIRELRARWGGTRFVCFQDDNPFGARADEHFWLLFRRCIPEFDLHLVKREEDVAKFRAAGARRVEL